MARLQETYAKEIAPALMKKFSYKSVMQIPKLDKVVINVGCGEARDNPKIMDAILSDLSKITGQKPVVCKAKKSVANFKLREGMPIGAKVTLRGERMYEFVDRFFSVALPVSYTHLTQAEHKTYASYSALLEGYYAEKDKAERLRQKSRELAKAVHNLYAVSYTHLDVYKRQQQFHAFAYFFRFTAKR